MKLVRSFGYPEDIEPGDVIWLELDSSQQTRIQLNQSWLGVFVGGITRIDVTSLLKPRNELSLNVDCPAADELDATILEAALLLESVADQAGKRQ